ncbi:hypothetical protein T11_4284 [Trichinella zimbabwensis]|uniref:Uncharacterized protein n=1 Tax=Trichinella zimbabwensis TaxID=268475 RepID=A0A0V1DSH1_9BILA|nr:hypothetical protein T11_4284 [Trichinella zimbabwensis]
MLAFLDLEPWITDFIVPMRSLGAGKLKPEPGGSV